MPARSLQFNDPLLLSNPPTGSEYSCGSSQEWSAYVSEDCSLFFIKCNPIVTQKSIIAGAADDGNTGQYFRNEFKRMSLRSDKRKDNIFSKLRKGKFGEDKKYFNVKITNSNLQENVDYISKDFTLDIVPSKKIGKSRCTFFVVFEALTNFSSRKHRVLR
jgi:hypothetical protein